MFEDSGVGISEKNLNTLFKDFKKLDPSKDIALVLIYGRFFSSEWHWVCYPIDKNISTFFGPDTNIDKVYLLKKDE